MLHFANGIYNDRIKFSIELYLYGESIKVVEHDVIGFRQQGGITLQGKGEQKREGEREKAEDPIRKTNLDMRKC